MLGKDMKAAWLLGWQKSLAGAFISPPTNPFLGPYVASLGAVLNPSLPEALLPAHLDPPFFVRPHILLPDINVTS